MDRASQPDFNRELCHGCRVNSRRRPLTHAGGQATLRGESVYAEPLRLAMEAQGELSDERSIHGFHSHAGRMHPGIARVLLRELSVGTRGTVLDPFCGCGTTMVEAQAAGWRSLGNDLDPVAIAVARVKTQRRDAAARERFAQLVQKIGTASELRVRERKQVHADLPNEELAWYDMHVVKELAGLLEEIREVSHEQDRLALEMVFSAIVVKFSRQKSDTRAQRVDKRLRKGLASEFFVRKGLELAAGWKALMADTESSTPSARFVQADMRGLSGVLGGIFRCELVLCSPPYAGTFDYLDHHARRRAWLGMSARSLRRGELGARRHFSGVGPSREGKPRAEHWREQVSAMLASVASVLREDGLAAFVVGDGAIEGKIEDASALLEDLAPQHELQFLAAASQTRPEFVESYVQGDGRGRNEHLVLLRKAAS